MSNVAAITEAADAVTAAGVLTTGARSAFENALWAWVRGASGYPAERVIWAQEGAPAPSGPFVSLRLGSVQVVGVDWYEVHDAESPAPGAEVEYIARGQREVTLTLQAFGGDGTGEQSPVAVLEGVELRATLPSYRAALAAAGVGISGFGPVQSLDGLLGKGFEPRAALEVRLLGSTEVSEFATYIESVRLQRVDGDGDPLGDEFEVSA